MLASDHPSELIMAKGYAKTEFGVWCGHWWCVDQEGRVVDPTWKNEVIAYVGLETETAESYAKRTFDAGTWELELPQIAPPRS
jgi:hypothetical protein